MCLNFIPATRRGVEQVSIPGTLRLLKIMSITFLFHNIAFLILIFFESLVLRLERRLETVERSAQQVYQLSKKIDE
jgi:hypothetical protein